ncbi:class I SAM-dependent methyltransferase [Salinibacter ruber]|nr:class I SAM-dependent methyltransferase [Salinibacter ruber]MCS3642213.1 2-polyprenyl-3-methyl-5-hydroxy-6-metoxy-1,4-benzoquinol methylase [Salinibacter ruber]MCS4182617.1 2-polyprenyl-3-methyl-5-hydroxy-6-metoxy-1,4-benzoquinol methylase [Salinibacter ruber]
MTSKWRKQSPKRHSVEKIRASREAISQSSIVENDWADTYVNNRDADLYRFANDLELLKEKVESGASVFEHGAAPFVLSHALASEGYDLYAGDASPERFPGTGDMPFQVVKHNIEKDTLDRMFDAVICNELFEHLRINLIDTFERVFDSLAPGGFLFLSTPNVASAEGIWGLLRQDRSYVAEEDAYHAWSKSNRIGHMGHVKEYTGSEVASFLENIGFEVLSIVYRNPHQYLGGGGG